MLPFKPISLLHSLASLPVAVAPFLVSCGAGSSSSATSVPVSKGSVEQESSSVAPAIFGEVELWRVAEVPNLRALAVAISVRPPPPLVERYVKWGAARSDLSEALRMHSEGGFGSGFVVVAGKDATPRPRLFVITNQHVVGLADTAKVSFQGLEDPVAAQVVLVHESYDLAILEVLGVDEGESSLSMAAGFGFSRHVARDQDVVIAAGYPGIAGEPSYQVTRGYVSNEQVELTIDGKKRVHIQHSAPIDPGSSGGPLLDSENRVLGVNTLKIRGREGVGLAVPAAAVEEALELALSSSNSEPGESLPEQREACLSLLRNIREEELQATERALSFHLVAERGEESLGSLPEDGTNWGQVFLVAPDEVLLRGLAYRLSDELLVGEGEPECDVEESGSFIQKGPRRLRIRFVHEQGRLKLREVDMPKKRARSILSPPRQKKWSPSLR